MNYPSTPTKLQTALLDAALAIIDARGHQALRARALTDAAGCALGGLYTAFADLDSLVLAVKMRILDQLDAIMLAVEATRGQANTTEGLLALARAYVDFALVHKRRWQTLFLYKLADDAESPDWYLARLAAIFAHVDAPLATLPALQDPARRDLVGRALFAGVHGIVILGIEGKLGAVTKDYILAQIDVLVRSSVAGMSA